MISNDESWEGKFINQYEVEAYLAHGGMADIYKAYDTQLKRVVCLKVMKKSLVDDAAFTRRFQREARTAASLDHPDIVKIFDTGVAESGQPFIVMEYIQNGSLDRLISTGELAWPLDPVYVLKLVKRVAAALYVAHLRRIYHRDLKPQNILMRDKKSPVLTDFGVAAVEEGTKLTRTGEMPGTPYYMSPEQIRGEQVDGRSDIYALGLILYELLAGSHPFAHLDPWQILEHQVLTEPPPLRLARDGLAEATYQVINNCLQKQPANRYQTIVDLLAAIDIAIEQEEPNEQVAAVPDTAANWRSFLQKNWVLLLLIVVVLVLLILTAVNLAVSMETGVAQAGVQNSFRAPTMAAAKTTPTETMTLIAIVVIPSPTLIPFTPTPTHTLIPPSAAPPTPTATSVLPTPTRQPINTVNNNSAVAPAPPATRCTEADISWGDFVEEFADRLGCATTGVVLLTRQNAAYQQFPEGLMMWRQDTERVYILDNAGSVSIRHVSSANASLGDCQPTLKNSFGWLWCTDSALQAALGIPVELERNASDFRAQDFANGAIFTYSESDFYYILFTDSGRWTAAAK